jgi:hypothetical protein
MLAACVFAATLPAMRSEDYFVDPPRDALAAHMQEEVAALAELFGNEGTRAVAILLTVIGDDGTPRACSLVSNMDDVERQETCGAILRAIEDNFGSRRQ